MPDFTSPVDELILAFAVTHKFDFFGKEVVLDMFPVGTGEQIVRATSGLDARATNYVHRVLSIVHAIRSIGGYDFKSSYDEKLTFVRALQEPLLDLMFAEYQATRVKQLELLTKKQEELKKSSPGQT